MGARSDRAPSHRGDVDAAVEQGAVGRVRPKLMTVTAIIMGPVPNLWSQGTGAALEEIDDVCRLAWLVLPSVGSTLRPN